MANEKLVENGFLHIPQIISNSLISDLLKKVNSNIALYKETDEILYENNTPKKLLYSFNKGEIFLKTMVSDPVLSLLIENCDHPCEIVPTWEDVVIKQPHTKNGFNPHQDLPMQSLMGNTFSLAIYMHNADHNPVYFLPKSHLYGALTRDQIAELYDKQKANFIPVKALAGDVVMHYAKTVHYSPDNFTAFPRYTWYIEFRTLRQLKHDSPWDLEWRLKRRAIFVYALKKYNPVQLDYLAPDYKTLEPYLANIQLKVPHVTSTVNFDMESPYYHF